jgi:threonine/homoserine/homoserine lactone efflux protein
MGYGTVKGLKTYQISGKVESEDAGLHPVISGIIVSLSNPYWFIWWITIGMGYVIFARELGIYGVVFFFLGHILSDLLWYSFISYGIHFGGRFFSIKIIKVILFICSLFMMLFGLFFILKGLQFILPSTQIFLLSK